MIRLEPNLVYSIAATFTALLGAGFDLKTRRIPNFITGPALLAFCAGASACFSAQWLARPA